MSDSVIWQEACGLAGNLASLWNGGSPVLQELQDAASHPEKSPWAAIQKLRRDGVERTFRAEEQAERLHAAFAALTRYLSAETWFDRTVAGDPRLGTLHGGPVAYFCAEFGLAPWLPIYSGGLGILAGDVLKEASDLGLPMVGVGLFYRHGYFCQSLDESGYQRESYPVFDPADLPLHPVLDRSKNQLTVAIPLADRTIFAAAWQLQVGRTTLYLLDTDLPSNARQEDREITSGLYAGNEETRIRQEIVLGIGGCRLLHALGIKPTVYSMNEGHAAFVGIELLAGFLNEGDFEEALRRTRERIVYTNHTVVPAGNDQFGIDLVCRYLGPYLESNGIGTERALHLAGAHSGRVSMALLAFQTSGKANAVSQLHGAVIPREWPGFDVEVVTNGVHVPSWLGNSVRSLLDKYVPDWQSDRPSWSMIEDIPDGELIEARCVQRQALVDFANRVQSEVRLDPDVLTLVWARRFAEYKRAGLVASDIRRLEALVRSADQPVQIIFAGKAHPRDEGGKRVLQDLILRVRANPATAGRIAFIPDYSIGVAQHLVAGADVWINTPRKPLEASGTSGMKSGDNGGLQLTVQDGWAAEVNWFEVGWGIEGRDDAADAEQLYWYLETDIVPAFYTRDDAGIPRRWAQMMKKTMAITLQRYSARRMMLDYIHKLYLPLIEQQQQALTVPTT